MKPIGITRRRRKVALIESLYHYYAVPSSGEAYSDRQLTLNFELWVKNFFVYRHVSIWGFHNPVCPSVCPYPEKRYHYSIVNISPTVVIDTSITRPQSMPSKGGWTRYFRVSLFERHLRITSQSGPLTRLWQPHLDLLGLDPLSQWSCRALATCKLVWHGRSN